MAEGQPTFVPYPEYAHIFQEYGDLKSMSDQYGVGMGVTARLAELESIICILGDKAGEFVYPNED